MTSHGLSLRQTCGQLLVGGFAGDTLPASFAAALRSGLRAGAILFRRNVPELGQTAALCEAIRDAAGDVPPFVAVDQEGGRVTRLPAPFLTLPPARKLAATGDEDLVRRAGAAVGEELAALGFNLDFAPVLDVDSNPANPIIGDRAYGSDPGTAARFGLAFAAGLASAGVLGCGKHFPGHGDTSVDSHLALPVVDHGRARLDAVELAPFRAAARAGLPTLMTAHVVLPALDAGVPATLSKRVCTDLLRAELGFGGLLFSDDLEMKAVADRYSVEESAVGAVRAGCDALLVCSREDWQERALDALVREAERDPAFALRCRESASRSLVLRRRTPPRPLGREGALAVVGSATSRALADEVAAAVARASTPGGAS
jgi:beta-N-acetylhexosaminidase